MGENEKVTYKIETTSNGRKRILLPDELSITTDTTLLTKTELHALRKVRRKLKNKISAQESRRRKKEYIENLEKRVCRLNEENELLRKKVETQDLSLRSLTRQIHQRINYKDDHKGINYRDDHQRINYNDDNQRINYKDDHQRIKYKEDNQGINYKEDNQGINYKDDHQGINYKDDKEPFRSVGTQTGICLKCYLHKRGNNVRDFEVKSGENGRIVIKSEPRLPRKLTDDSTESQLREKTWRTFSDSQIQEDDDVFLDT